MSVIVRPGAVPRGSTGGVAMMLLGVLLFAVNDTLGKWLVGTYTVGQLKEELDKRGIPMRLA